MTALHHRCWNHDAREAVCRCPQCGRGFCRECVTEHEARLLCASCLHALTHTGSAKVSGWRKLIPAAMAMAGILLAWVIFWGAGETLILFTGRIEQSSWRNR
jgi:hypothetical protein